MASPVKTSPHRNQLTVFFTMLGVYALCAFVTYGVYLDQLTGYLNLPAPKQTLPLSPLELGLANAAIVLVIYGLAGLAAYWFAIQLELPGIYSEDGNWQRWMGLPMVIGLVAGLVLVGAT